MAVRYYPKNRVRTGLYTAGGEITVNGQEYVGYYYETYDGKIFTGNSPEDLTGNIPAARIQDVFSNSKDPRSTDTAGALRVLTSIIPSPTMQDYKRGYFVRYFGKRTDNTEGIIEVSKDNYQRLKDRTGGAEDYLYQVTELFWKLTGPLNDTRENRTTPTPGIVETNKRIVETKEKTFPGIKAYIGGDYTRFATPT